MVENQICFERRNFFVIKKLQNILCLLTVYLIFYKDRYYRKFEAQNSSTKVAIKKLNYKKVFGKRLHNS